ncbi:hypothetical protein RR48_07922 [Papilio machaon]|uniref:Integral membrane protein 2 n=1 Tax=Papilio machaon TaxID=76193 RepID=A0A194QQ32_PAPMA|nr:hypothetical protein RR48_07922 [Papilio machaon]
MIVFPKGCFPPNKTEIAKLPLVEEVACPEAKVAVPPLSEKPEPRRYRVPGPLRRFAVMIFHFMNISMLLILFVAVSVFIYRQYVYTNSMRRYRGYCTIPIDLKNQGHLIESNFHVMPLRWSSEPELHVVSTSDAATAERLLSVLREELDIDREGMTEKISVFNNGHQVNFIHDFTNNLTNIVDEERCFITDLDLESVLVPDAFIASIESGGEFDVTRVRSGLRALLPALHDLASLPGLPASCRTRPTYRLQQDRTRLVRKRSVDAKPHDYVHFSGRLLFFITDLDLESVLVPDAFIASIESGGEFDVTRVRSGLRALLPALHDLASLPGLPASCRTRPTYRLQQDRTRLVRKRSVDAKPHDYVHFSGKHIHEIDIGNLPQLLQHEQNKTE